MENLLPKFTWITLGVEGGLDESSLSAHLVAPFGSTGYIFLDAGTMLAGLKAAARNGCFDDIRLNDGSNLSVEGTVLHKHIKAYLITHPYLDHVEGLVVISPIDVPNK
jgi:3',5'-cyclic-nucleotide phosphodiesterase